MQAIKRIWINLAAPELTITCHIFSCLFSEKDHVASFLGVFCLGCFFFFIAGSDIYYVYACFWVVFFCVALCKILVH